jgi:hypothetical protein
VWLRGNAAHAAYAHIDLHFWQQRQLSRVLNVSPDRSLEEVHYMAALKADESLVCPDTGTSSESSAGEYAYCLSVLSE